MTSSTVLGGCLLQKVGKRISADLAAKTEVAEQRKKLIDW